MTTGTGWKGPVAGRRIIMLSVCGLACNECYAFGDTCPGCQRVEGKPFWVAEYGADACELYKCCNGRKYQDCGECPSLPCEAFVRLKDPKLSDEEHAGGIKARVQRLKANRA